MTEHTQIYLKAMGFIGLVFGTAIALTWGTETAFLPIICLVVGTVVCERQNLDHPHF